MPCLSHASNGEAQDHGGDGAARGRHAAVGAGGDGRCLPRRRARRRQAGPWRAGQDALRGGGLHSPEGRPRKVKLVPVKGFRKREIARGAKRWLAPGSEVLTDGLRCWNALDGVVGSHRAIRTGSGRQAARMAPFKWVNTTLGNIKSAITGTYRKLGPDHAQRYLASFAWRYNRRYQLNTMIGFGRAVEAGGFCGRQAPKMTEAVISSPPVATWIHRLRVRFQSFLRVRSQMSFFGWARFVWRSYRPRPWVVPTRIQPDAL